MTLKDMIISGQITVSGGTAPTGTIEISENGTYDVTDYASADVNVSGGGGGDFATGVINEAENTNTATINTGGDYDHFVMYAETEVSGHGVLALRVIVADFSVEESTLIFFTTNNSGTGVGSQGYYVDNVGVTKSGSVITYNHNATNLIAGVNYRWVAW